MLHTYLYNIFSNITTIHYPTALAGLVTIFTLLYLARFKFSTRLPPPLVAIILFIIISVIWAKSVCSDCDLEDAGGVYRNPAGIELVGEVPSGFPTPEVPTFPANDTPQLILIAITVALVGFLER